MGDIAIVVNGEKLTIQRTPISGDVAITPAGISIIGTGKVTIAMLDPAIHKYLLPVGIVGISKVGFCVVAP